MKIKRVKEEPKGEVCVKKGRQKGDEGVMVR